MAPALATLQVAAPHHLSLPRPRARASRSGASFLALEVARNSGRRWPSSPSADAVLPKSGIVKDPKTTLTPNTSIAVFGITKTACTTTSMTSTTIVVGFDKLNPLLSSWDLTSSITTPEDLVFVKFPSVAIYHYFHYRR
ncbi:hypothetical protein TRIUR3_30862 [Triticum urartu]|uniref:Uncharacterized protein n=1 Tax=Triticum urartu TaxID=4572 RepID=M7ZMC5_TRIUA|nr:hypothetical protein TRIUR3_30862 [Triticum urartu]